MQRAAPAQPKHPTAVAPLLVWTPSGWEWVPVLAAIWVVYEVLRAVVVSAAKHRYEAHVDSFLNQHDIPIDNFRYTHRVVVKERVLGDPGLILAMDERAREEGRTLHAVQIKVREWLDEIVPQFNILAYYKIGFTLGRTAAYSVYNVRLDQVSLDDAQEKLPEDAAVVYVSNHRSNADFVVTGFMLSKSVQVSYAVGEWARVWPLEKLFKSFGSYFVRRGEKDPLYHRTLESYLQLVTKQGVTQAMFPEGGLSRDGRLRPVKMGLLDYMTRAKLDPTFTRPLVFVPVGINFDRVLEDENLVAEAVAGDAGAIGRPKRSLPVKAWRLLTLIGKSLYGLPINLARFLTKRVKKHGVAAIHFGDPVVFDDWYEQQEKKFLDEPDRYQRQDALRPFANDLLRRVGQNIPVTPATLACAALVGLGRERMLAGVDRGAVLMAMRDAHTKLMAADAPMAIGNPYQADADRRSLQRRARAHVVDISADVDRSADLGEVLDRALDVMEERGLLRSDGGRFCTDEDRWPLVEYYANSLAQHYEK